MSIISAIVLFAIVWFMVFFIALPIRLKTQGDVGEIVPGTHAGAPAEHQLKKKGLDHNFCGLCFMGWFCRRHCLRKIDGARSGYV